MTDISPPHRSRTYKFLESLKICQYKFLESLKLCQSNFILDVALSVIYILHCVKLQESRTTIRHQSVAAHAPWFVNCWGNANPLLSLHDQCGLATYNTQLLVRYCNYLRPGWSNSETKHASITQRYRVNYGINFGPGQTWPQRVLPGYFSQWAFPSHSLTYPCRLFGGLWL